MKAHFFDSNKELNINSFNDCKALISSSRALDIVQVFAPMPVFIDMPNDKKVILHYDYTIKVNGTLPRNHTHLIIEKDEYLYYPIVISKIENDLIKWESMGDPPRFKR